MAGQQRVYRQRIRSTESLKKIFRAMELIAASRIGKARDRVTAATPYSRALTRAAWLREETRGGHYRTDFPKPADAWKRRVEVRLDAEGVLQVR